MNGTPVKTQDRFGAVISVVALLGLITAPTWLQAVPVESQTTYETPGAAVEALISACRRHARADLLALFGPDGKDLVDSGDRRQDKENQSRFARAAQSKSHLIEDPMNPDRVVVSIGEEDWPFPVPLIRQAGRWHFDTAEGRQEILARRIGDNETNAMEISRSYVMAQLDYAQSHRQKGIPVYAQQIVSSPGKDDGLYRKPSKARPPSRLPKGFARAAMALAADPNVPYQGYYFRILKAQGPAAKGGAVNYVVDGQMIGGFALIAWPAQYGASGIQTFIINHDDNIYQKSLGPETATLAPQITEFNPDASWHTVQSE